MDQFAVALGNAFKGISLYGPFESKEKAHEWGEQYVRDHHQWPPTEWEVISLNDPDF